MPLMKDVMTPMLHTIEPHQPLAVARERMGQWRIRHLPVLVGGRLVGVLAQRDMDYLATFPGVDLGKATVKDAMADDVFTVPVDQSLKAAAAAMVERQVGSALVVDGEGKLMGIFTSTDALRILAEEAK